MPDRQEIYEMAQSAFSIYEPIRKGLRTLWIAVGFLFVFFGIAIAIGWLNVEKNRQQTRAIQNSRIEASYLNCLTTNQRRDNGASAVDLVLRLFLERQHSTATERGRIDSILNELANTPDPTRAKTLLNSARTLAGNQPLPKQVVLNNTTTLIIVNALVPKRDNCRAYALQQTAPHKRSP